VTGRKFEIGDTIYVYGERFKITGINARSYATDAPKRTGYQKIGFAKAEDADVYPAVRSEQDHIARRERHAVAAARCAEALRNMLTRNRSHARSARAALAEFDATK